jgi:hypothetical protein
MRLPTVNRTPKAIGQPVSVDEMVAVIGGTADELIKRFGSQGDNWLGRPTISFEDAQRAHAEWQQRQVVDMLLPIRYERYCDDRKRRLFELQVDACAKARASFVGPHAGGADQQRYMQVQWEAERRVIADFEAAEPELTISQFRDQEKQRNA